jgi:hypothetical protein
MGLGMGLDVRRGGAAAAFDPADLVATYGGWIADFASDYVTLGAAPDIATLALRADTKSIGSLTQATASKRPHAAAVGSNASGDFDSAAVQALAATSGGGDPVKWMHASTGASLFVVFRRTGGTGTQHLLDTCNNNVSQHGVNINVSGTTGVCNASARNGSGTSHVACTKAAAHTVNVVTLVEFVWSSATGGSLWVNGGTPKTASASGSASTTNATGGLTLGCLVAQSTQGFDGDLFFAAGLQGVVSEDDRVAMRDHLATRFGVTLV